MKVRKLESGKVEKTAQMGEFLGPLFLNYLLLDTEGGELTWKTKTRL